MCPSHPVAVQRAKLPEGLAITQPQLTDISDTARWAAWCRAVETARADALFRDPFAALLAGPQGAALEQAMVGATVPSVVTRTFCFDQLLQQRLAEGGVDTVVNLAAGLDTRPYRLALPEALRWIEVDLPALVAAKAAMLAHVRPYCRVERHAWDLSEPHRLFGFLSSVVSGAVGVVVMTEALLLYLPPDTVFGLGRALAQLPTARTWLTDVLSPDLLPVVRQRWERIHASEDVKPHFAPHGGMAWFAPLGWRAHQQLSARDESLRLQRPIGPPLPEALNEALRWSHTYVRLERC